MEQLSLFGGSAEVDELGIPVDRIKKAIAEVDELGIHEKIQAINEIRQALHEISPFASEPVDFVMWVKNDTVAANDYNPNKVAPPEMELLRTSIAHDGYTQPIVTMAGEDGQREVIDGFHRNRVGKECPDIQEKVHGYLPVVQIRESQSDKSNRIASTIRHNRARGKHQVDSMSDIVIELKRRNWSDKRIAKELGMDQDEILRLCQITGLTDVFANDEFTMAWDIESVDEENIEEAFVSVEEDAETDSKRIFHTFDKWECQKAGFYESKPPKGMSKEEAENTYVTLLSNTELFESVLQKVIDGWEFSCEHYLSNENMNRIAWLGQASLCFEYGIPSCFRTGYNLLTEEQQKAADESALKYLNIWLERNGFDPLRGLEDAESRTKAELY